MRALREVSLTGSHAASARAWPACDWRAGQPFFNVDPALKAGTDGAAAGAGPSYAVPDGFDRQGHWVAGNTSFAGGARAGFRPSEPLEDYAAGAGASRACWQGPSWRWRCSQARSAPSS